MDPAIRQLPVSAIITPLGRMHMMCRFMVETSLQFTTAVAQCPAPGSYQVDASSCRGHACGSCYREEARRSICLELQQLTWKLHPKMMSRFWRSLLFATTLLLAANNRLYSTCRSLCGSALQYSTEKSGHPAWKAIVMPAVEHPRRPHPTVDNYVLSISRARNRLARLSHESSLPLFFA